MDVNELLSFQPEKPAVGVTKRQYEDNDYERSLSKRAKKGTLTDEEKERILQMADSEQDGVVDDIAVKKMILQFEKRVYKNQEMRIKYPDMPEKFMESEMELNEMIHEMHVIATVPDLFHILVDLNAVQSLLQLLHHDNTDISIAVVDLLQELTESDAVSESEDSINHLIDSLMSGQVIALLVQNLERLDEGVKEESDGLHNTLAIVENLTDIRPEVCVDCVSQGLMAWLLRRIKAKMPPDTNKLYCTEILAILIQNTDQNRESLGDIDGIDILLQQLASYKRHDPTNAEEVEIMENLFNCMCSALMLTSNKERFLKGEGLQLMNLMLREKKMSRTNAIKVLNHAMTGEHGKDNCQKFVDILGLRNVFPLFMKAPKVQKKVGPSKRDLDEHIVSVIAAMVTNTLGTQRQRLLNKFVENDHEKVDRLMELHFECLERVRITDERIQREKDNLGYSGDEDVAEEMEEQFYLQRLEAGLFTLQLVDYIMLDISVNGPPGVRQRVMQILNMRGGSIKAIKSIMREYAGNIGDADSAERKEEEQRKLLQLVEKF